MKQITLSHTTALAALRDLRTNGSISQSLLSIMMDTDTKIHVLTSDINKIRNSKNYIRHFQPKIIPNKSFIEINEKYRMTCPEFMIIQMSSKLSFEKLALLVLELCGTYSIDPQTNSFVSTEHSITNISKIQNYLNRYWELNKCGHGLKKLESVINFCENNSASPMESRLYIKIAGPRSKGLYGCKKLIFNKTTKISKSAKKIAGQEYIRPDLSNATNKVAIEYDSAVFHKNTEQAQRDKRRRDALVYDGWKVHTIVPQQLQDPYAFDVIARKILKDMKQDNRIRGKHFELKRNQAFEELK